MPLPYSYYTVIDAVVDVNTYQIPSNLFGGVSANTTFADAVTGSIFAAGGVGRLADGRMKSVILDGFSPAAQGTEAFAGSPAVAVYDVTGSGTLMYTLNVGANTNPPPVATKPSQNGGIGFRLGIVGTGGSIVLYWHFDESEGK